MNRCTFRASRGVSRPPPAVESPVSAPSFNPPEQVRTAPVPVQQPSTFLEPTHRPLLLPPISPTQLVRRLILNDAQVFVSAVGHASEKRKPRNFSGSFAASMNRCTFRASRGVHVLLQPPAVESPVSAPSFNPPEQVRTAPVPAAPSTALDVFGSDAPSAPVASDQPNTTAVGHASEQRKPRTFSGSFAASLNRCTFRASRGGSRPSPTVEPPVSAPTHRSKLALLLFLRHLQQPSTFLEPTHRPLLLPPISPTQLLSDTPRNSASRGLSRAPSLRA
ncbi:hypothetical protein L596_024744 [Steinernema carpocapsae]|nr:hypothetical protein L596_024744 [Steinernema carpocapsae]